MPSADVVIRRICEQWRRTKLSGSALFIVNEADDRAQMKNRIGERVAGGTLADDPTHARPIVWSLLKRRVTIGPLDERRRWRLAGERTLSGLFERTFSRGETAQKTIPRCGVPRASRSLLSAATPIIRYAGRTNPTRLGQYKNKL